MMTIIKSLKRWFTLLASIIAFLVLVIVSIPIILDSHSVQKALSGFISTKILAGVKPDKITFSLFPSPSIEFSSITVTREPFQNSSIEKIVVHLSPYSLVRGKLAIKKISLQNPLLPRASTLLSTPFTGEDIFEYFSQEQGKFSVEIKNMKSDSFKSADILVDLSPAQKTISGNLTIDNPVLSDSMNLTHPNPIRTHLLMPPPSVSQLTARFLFSDIEHFNIDLTVFKPSINLPGPWQPAIKIDKIVCNIKETDNEFTIITKDMAIEPFASSLVMEFKHDKNRNKTSLLFSGKQVNIDNVRPVALNVMPNDFITKKIFDILQGGVVKDVKVFFQNTPLTLPSKKISPATNETLPVTSVKGKSYHLNGREIELPETNSSSISNVFNAQALKALFDPLEMTIKGELNNGTVNIPATSLTATKTDGIVTVKRGLLHTEIIKGGIETSTIDKGTLDVNLLHNDHAFTGEFQISADLSHLNRVLQSLIPISSISKELATLHDIQGNTSGTLKLKGGNHHKPSISVTTGDITLNGRYPRLPRELSITGGEFQYSDDMVTVTNMTGKVGQSIFSKLSATLTLDGLHTLNITSGTAGIALEELLPWLASLNIGPSILQEKDIKEPSTLSDSELPSTTSILAGIRSILPIIQSSTGELQLTEAAFKGSLLEPLAWDYLFQGNVNALTLRQRPGMDDISDINANFLLSPSTTSISIDTASIERTELLSLLTNRSIGANAKNKNSNIELNISSRLNDIRTPFTITDGYFHQSVKNNDQDIDFSGNALFNRKTELYVSGTKVIHSKKNGAGSLTSKTDEKKAEYQIKLIDSSREIATISYDTERQPSIRFSGKLDTQTIETLLNPISSTYHSLSSLTGGREFTIASNQSDHYTIRTEELDLNFILEKRKLINRKIEKLPIPIFSSKASSLKTTEPPSPIFITLNCDRLIHKKITLSPFSANIDITGKDKRITIKKMELFNINGSATINIRDNIMALSIKLDDNNKNIEPVMAKLYHGERLMEGNYSLKASLSSHAVLSDTESINIDLIKKNLTGTIKMSSDGGRIFRLTLLSRILSIINISKLMEGKFPDIEQNGFAFNSINVVADVNQGRIILKQAVINGLDMTLLFVGWIDPFTGAIDLTCLVAPFKTADSIIKNIPIINTMLGGRLISLPVKAVGTLSNPDVTILNPSEVAKNILHTMRDILMTPFQLMDVIK